MTFSCNIIMILKNNVISAYNIIVLQYDNEVVKVRCFELILGLRNI